MLTSAYRSRKSSPETRKPVVKECLLGGIKGLGSGRVEGRGTIRLDCGLASWRFHPSRWTRMFGPRSTITSPQLLDLAGEDHCKADGLFIPCCCLANTAEGSDIVNRTFPQQRTVSTTGTITSVVAQLDRTVLVDCYHETVTLCSFQRTGLRPPTATSTSRLLRPCPTLPHLSCRQFRLSPRTTPMSLPRRQNILNEAVPLLVY